MRLSRIAPAALLLLAACLAHRPCSAAEEDYAAWFSPVVGAARTTVSYESTWFAPAGVRDADADLSRLRQQLRASVPLSQDARNEWTVNGRFGSDHLHTDARLPASGDRLPEDLWEVGAGAGYRHRFENLWTAGGSLYLGSPSDRPFHAWSAVEANATGWLRVPDGERNAWLFFLTYSNNWSFGPSPVVPGIAYSLAPSERLRAVVGFPVVMLDYRPTETVGVQLGVLPIGLGARATWKALERTTLYTALEWSSKQYLREDRPDDEDRLRLSGATARVGAQLDLSADVSLDLFLGYAFARSVSETEKWSDRKDNELRVKNAPLAGLRASVKL